MHIAIITHKVAKGDGQGRINYEVVKALLEGQHQVTLLCSDVDQDLRGHLQVSWVRIHVNGWPTELLRNQLFAWKSSRWIRKHRDRINLVVANGAITWAAADVNAAHMIHSAWLQSPVHTAKSHKGPYAWYQWLYTFVNARWERIAFKQARKLVAVSERVKEQIAALGFAEEKINVISNGVDLSEFRPGSADRSELGLPEGVVLAFFAGDIRRPLKNLDTILKALVNTPGLHVAIAGDTEGSPFPEMTKSLGLSSRVHYLGFRRDIPQLMRVSDFFVFPSRYESFSLVLLEAMASGLPVITAKTVGAANLVSADCGIVLENPNDVESLAIAMRELVADGEQRIEMGKAARDVALSQSFDRMREGYMQLFNSILESDASQSAQPSLGSKTSLRPA